MRKFNKKINIKKDEIILGINVSHNSSAAIMINNKIELCIQEERLLNKKSFFGYPKKSIDYCLSFVKKKNLKISKAFFTTVKLPAFSCKFPVSHFYNIKEFQNFYGEEYYSKKLKGISVEGYLKKLEKDKRNSLDLYLPLRKLKKKDHFNFGFFRNIQKKFLQKQLKDNKVEITFLDHHSCHAAYSYYSSKKRINNSAIITLDSEGDGLNQTVWIIKNNSMKKISQSSQCDIGRVYKLTTLFLGMKPDEHEYKVMGMAPYAKGNYSIEVFNKVYKDLLKVKGLKIIHNKRPKDLYSYLKEKNAQYRFDNISGGVQIFVESLATKLIKNIYKKFKIKNYYITGGVSMNIKMNKSIKDLPFVKNLIVQPSGADESLSMGGCFFVKKESSKPITQFYLGRDLYDGINKKDFFKKIKKNKNFKLFEKFSHNELAKLLSKGNIIAVARGREEFGARALGNRSIIADPSKIENIQRINEYIKNRDFWMPFALTILDKFAKTYIHNKKKIISEYMTIGYDTKSEKHSKIISGTHRYDKTVRPQMLIKSANPQYYSIIESFYKLKKIPALLNTSLNLHGYPLSSTMKEVMNTFENSKLQYLYLDDYYLIEKKNA